MHKKLEKIFDWCYPFLKKLELGETISAYLSLFVNILLMSIIAYLIYFVFRFLLVTSMVVLAKKTKTKFDDLLVTNKTAKYISHLIPLLFIYKSVPIILKNFVYWESVFGKLKATMGCYSILGNHDYGYYSRWKSQQNKVDNFDKIVAANERLGFTLLRNQNVLLERNGQSIALAGVEYWGTSGHYPNTGNLALASKGIEAIVAYAKDGTKPAVTEGLGFFNTGVNLVTDKPVDGVPSSVAAEPPQPVATIAASASTRRRWLIAVLLR